MNQKIPGKFEMTEEEFERQYVEATRRGEEDLANAPKAISAKYNSKTERLIIELQNGVTFMVPTDLVQGLRGASEKDLKEVELWLEGMYLHWEKLDVDFRVSSLMQGTFGTQRWMAEISSQNKNEHSKLDRKVA